MAFKPFNFFRKHAKILMAATVLLAMFSFIVADALSMRGSGGSMFAQKVKGWFGIVDHQIANVDGKGYDFDRLYQVFNQRRLAAEYVAAVQRTGMENVLRDAGFTREDRSSRERYNKKLEEVRKNNPDAVKAIESPPSTLSIEAALQPFRSFEQQVEQYNQLQQYRSMGFDPSMFGNIEQPKESDSPVYPLSLVEHLYWLKKADDLGVVFSTEAVRRDLVRTGYDRIRPEELGSIANDLLKQRGKGVSTDQLVQYVADEIRAMMAKAAVQDPERFGSALLSTQVTPYDLWKAYQEIKTQLVVGVLPIRVDSNEFLSRVELPPAGDKEKWKEFAESKLKPLFEAHKEKEPDPSRDTPGFKVPKRVQIEFLHGDLRGSTDARKYYERMAATEDGLSLAVQAMSGLGLPLPTTQAQRALSLYEANKLRGRYSLKENPISMMLGGVELADGSRYQLPLPAGPGPFATGPGVEKQTVSQHVLDVASALVQAPATPFGIGVVLRPTPRKVDRTLPQPHPLEAAGLAAALAGGMGPLQPGSLGLLSRVDLSERSQPFSEVAPAVLDEMIEDQCRVLLDRDLDSLQKDLSNFGKTYRTEFEKWKRLKNNFDSRGVKAPDFTPPLFTRKEGDKEVKEPVRDYIARFAKSRGLTYEGMKEPRGPFELFVEKDASPMGSILRPVLTKAIPPMDTRRPDDLVRGQLLANRGLFEPRDAQAPTAAMRDPTVKPWEYVVHWKVAETDARVPTFAEAEEKVLDAWKLQEARKLVEEQARHLAKQAKTEDGERILRDKEGYLLEKILARYEGIAFNYKKSNITYIDMPPDDLIDQALNALKDKGDTLLVANKPKSIYYLLVLKNRDEPKATSQDAIAKFDFDVIVPDQPLQIRVDNETISQWVQHQQTREFLKQWRDYLRNKTQYAEKDAEAAWEQFKSASRN